MSRLRRALPVLVVVVGLVALMYPLAFVFGLPLALRDMQDLRKWQRATITAQPVSILEPIDPESTSGTVTLEFRDAPQNGVLVYDDEPLERPYDQDGRRVSLPTDRSESLIEFSETLEPLSPTLYRFSDSIAEDDPERALYMGDTLAVEGATHPREIPDGQRLTFHFGEADGPVLLGGDLLSEGEDYTTAAGEITFARAPPFGSNVRRVSGDYAVLDSAEGTVVFAAPPQGEVRAASRVVRLAEVLQGEVDGENTRFRLERGNVLENDRTRQLFVGSTPLADTAERPQERVDGQQTRFTFESSAGLVVVEGQFLAEGAGYTRDGATVVFSRPPPRNAQLRQHPDYVLSNPREGEVTLARAPAVGEVVWAKQYTVYAQPGCGADVLECFLALPQHPVPFPHWTVARVMPFVQRYPLSDPRNIGRAALYTSLGTLYALLLGAALGVLLGVLFVFLRPLERALLPWAVASQTVPIIALVPVLLLVLGNAGITIQTSLLPTALIGAYIAFFPVAVGTTQGLRSADPLALDLMRSYAASPWQVLTKVRFPAAVPFLFTSLKLGTAAALVGALVAETESNNRRGLGYAILGQVQTGNVADVWILLVISALLGIGLVALVGLLGRLVAPWRRT